MAHLSERDMQRVIIIGNSGAARECYWLYQDMCAGETFLTADTEFGGFLSWKHYPADLRELSDLQKGDADSYPIRTEDRFVIGIGEPSLRKAVFEAFKAKGASFFTLRHPISALTESASIGEANIFQRGSTVFCNAQLGNANYLNGSVNLSHDAEVGNYNFFGPFSLVLGGVRVGDGNLVAVRSTLLPNSRIGNGNILAPHSVIYKGCGDRCRMAGNPALDIGTV